MRLIRMDKTITIIVDSSQPADPEAEGPHTTSGSNLEERYSNILQIEVQQRKRGS